MKRLILILLICFTLQGCGGLIIGATAGGIIAYKGRNLSQDNEDHKLAVTLQQSIYDANPDLKKNARLVISASDGNVLLAGQVPSEQDKNQIISLAKKTAGIKRLYDEISIGEPISAKTQSHDAWITTKVKSDLLAAKGLDSSDIKVITENSVVYLMGMTTPKQAQIASETARKSSGVAKVVTMLESKP
jgi:osmotically-inducible protein OsmY